MPVFVLGLEGSRQALEATYRDLIDRGLPIMRRWPSPQATPAEYLVVGNRLSPIALRRIQRSDVDIVGFEEIGLADRPSFEFESNEDALETILPEALTPEMASMLQLPSFSWTRILLSKEPGIKAYPCCGGINDHTQSCEYRTKQAQQGQLYG